MTDSKLVEVARIIKQMTQFQVPKKVNSTQDKKTDNWSRKAKKTKPAFVKPKSLNLNKQGNASSTSFNQGLAGGGNGDWQMAETPTHRKDSLVMLTVTKNDNGDGMSKSDRQILIEKQHTSVNKLSRPVKHKIVQKKNQAACEVKNKFSQHCVVRHKIPTFQQDTTPVNVPSFKDNVVVSTTKEQFKRPSQQQGGKMAIQSPGIMAMNSSDLHVMDTCHINTGQTQSAGSDSENQSVLKCKNIPLSTMEDIRTIVVNWLNRQSKLSANYIMIDNDIDDATFHDEWSKYMIERYLSEQVDEDYVVDKSEISVQLMNVEELDIKTKFASNTKDEFSTVSEGKTDDKSVTVIEMESDVELRKDVYLSEITSHIVKNDIDDASFYKELCSQSIVKQWLSEQVGENKMIDKSEINVQLVNVEGLNIKTKSASNTNDEFSTVSEGQTNDKFVTVPKMESDDELQKYVNLSEIISPMVKNDIDDKNSTVKLLSQYYWKMVGLILGIVTYCLSLI